MPEGFARTFAASTLASLGGAPACGEAKGMAQVAKSAGLGRESLYKALTPGAKPRFDTILKVAQALGVRLVAQPCPVPS